MINIYLVFEFYADSSQMHAAEAEDKRLQPHYLVMRHRAYRFSVLQSIGRKISHAPGSYSATGKALEDSIVKSEENLVHWRASMLSADGMVSAGITSAAACLPLCTNKCFLDHLLIYNPLHFTLSSSWFGHSI